MLARHINDNVYKNIEQLSVLTFDEKEKAHKEESTEAEKDHVIEKLIAGDTLKKQLDKATDKILLAHRNTKLFLFMMTGPFFIIMNVFKYLGKGLFYFTLFRYVKKKAVDDKSKEDTKEKEELAERLNDYDKEKESVRLSECITKIDNSQKTSLQAS